MRIKRCALKAMYNTEARKRPVNLTGPVGEGLWAVPLRYL